VRIPGDKSISHRLGMLMALANGRSTLSGYLTSEDCLNTLKAVEAMGAGIRVEGDRVQVCGTGGLFKDPGHDLDMGNSGTGMRLLAGVLAGQGFTSRLIGDASLCSRPMRRIQDPLQAMGARVELTGPKGCAPVTIHGGHLSGIEYRSPVASAQVKSCVLLAGLFARGATTVVEPELTRDHTERLFAKLGLPIECDGTRIRLAHGSWEGPQIRASDWEIPGDISSAAFWMVAASVREGACVTLSRVGLNPRRTAVLDVLRRMGADIDVDWDGRTGDAGEPMGTLQVRGRRLKGTEIGGREIPNLIDELPILAVAGALAEGDTVIRDAAELRVKESDRIATMAEGLRRMGVRVDEQPDGMRVRGGTEVRGGAEVDSLGDHRIAMSMSVLALSAREVTRVNQVACVATSYPGFLDHLNRLSGRENGET
jgi:3-phosphoshikimate 1-carboxyvinyltransferase